MKMNVFSFVVIAVSFLAIVTVLTEPKYKKEAVKKMPIEKEEAHLSDISDEDQRRIAYNLGYNRGYSNGYNNFVKPDMNSKDDEYIVEYTSNKDEEDKIDLESEDIQEIIMKGYVDGYHKACDSIGCPRSHY